MILWDLFNASAGEGERKTPRVNAVIDQATTPRATKTPKEK